MSATRCGASRADRRPRHRDRPVSRNKAFARRLYWRDTSEKGDAPCPAPIFSFTGSALLTLLVPRELVLRRLRRRQYPMPIRRRQPRSTRKSCASARPRDGRRRSCSTRAFQLSSLRLRPLRIFRQPAVATPVAETNGVSTPLPRGKPASFSPKVRRERPREAQGFETRSGPGTPPIRRLPPGHGTGSS